MLNLPHQAIYAIAYLSVIPLQEGQPRGMEVNKSTIFMPQTNNRIYKKVGYISTSNIRTKARGQIEIRIRS